MRSAYLRSWTYSIFLAIAMFALTTLAHAIVSNASILEMRHEPLYVLALAAGLLSEQAYAAVKIRAETALEKYRNRSGGDEHDTNRNESQ
jgi:hypothetical protein